MASSKSGKPRTSKKSSPVNVTGLSQQLSQSPANPVASPAVAKPKPATPVPAPAFGPRRIGESILFIASFPKANAVFIAGSFNAWNPHKTPLSKAPDGSWQVTIPLSKGLYKYRFVVDGSWQHDPHNSITEKNEFGGLNSVLKVD
jgi:hypothetical protein